MKGTIGLVLLALGIVVSASFAARNGERHVSFRQAEAAVQFADEEGRAFAVGQRDTLGLPPPEQRLREWFAVGGLGWGVGLLLIGVGAGLARLQQAEDNAGTGDTGSERVDFRAAVLEARARVVTVREQLEGLAMDADSTAPRETLDRLASDVLEPLVDGRGQLIARHGLAGFAEYFGTFSAAERNLNRCWSALTDGHAVVAREALEAADQALEACLGQFEAVEGRLG